MFYTKEMIHKEFEMATQKDQRTAGKPSKVKEVFTQRIKYLKELKEDMMPIIVQTVDNEIESDIDFAYKLHASDLGDNAVQVGGAFYVKRKVGSGQGCVRVTCS